MTEIVHVALAERSYDIHVGPGLLARAGELIKPRLPSPRTFIVTDENLERLHLDQLRHSLAAAGIETHCVVLPAGEQTKSIGHLEALLHDMLEARCERSTTIIALGGGVIGDLTGFAAAILLRGVPFIQIPTTLLAQIDSSVGGKTGVNTRQGKNLVGSFHQPRLVIADIDLLATLPSRELRSGYAEMVKYGLIDDADFFAWLETRGGAAVLAGDSAARSRAVLTCCSAKARIVAADEREEGRRALLNLGHTFAHALEAEAGYGDSLSHGEAVSIGLVMAFDLSVRLGDCPAEDLARLRRHLDLLSLPIAPPHLPGVTWTAGSLMRHLAGDKKVRDGKVTFVLAKGIGQAFLCREVPGETVQAVLDDAIEAPR